MFMPFLCINNMLRFLPSQNSLRDAVDPTPGGQDGHAEVSLCAVPASVPVVCLWRGLTNQDLRYGRKEGRKERIGGSGKGGK